MSALPEYFRTTICPRQLTRKYEQPIGQTIQILLCQFMSRLLGTIERHQRAFGTPTNRARQMCTGSSFSTARQDKVFQRWQIGIDAVDVRFQLGH